MTWEDRLQPGVYVAPSGSRHPFQFTDVDRSRDLRGTAHDFIEVNGTYVQRTGHGAGKYPLTCFFSGPNCDLEATAFEAATAEAGVGRLEHPVYGTFPAVALGEVARKDALVSAANQAIVTVTFWATLTDLYPLSTTSPRNEIDGFLDDHADAMAEHLADVSQIKTIQEQAEAKATTQGLLDGISSALQGISDTTADVRGVVTSAQREIDDTLDVLIGQPLLLARQILALIAAPGKAIAAIGDRLKAYGDLADSIFGSDAGATVERVAESTLPLHAERTQIANDFHLSDLSACGALAGAVGAVVAEDGSATFKTRSDAINAAAYLLELLRALQAWREAGFGALKTLDEIGPYQIDDGAAIGALTDATTTAVNYLTQLSFSLVVERAYYLTGPRPSLEVCAELYQKIDSETLDFFIASNDLTGDEILMLPEGRRVVYYPN